MKQKRNKPQIFDVGNKIVRVLVYNRSEKGDLTIEYPKFFNIGMALSYKME